MASRSVGNKSGSGRESRTESKHGGGKNFNVWPGRIGGRSCPRDQRRPRRIISLSTNCRNYRARSGGLKLVWHSQHPARQRRDLGLNLTNEFAFNSRIHPLAAKHANDTFDAALRSLKKRRDACFSVIDTLNSTGLTERISLRDQTIEPTFFRLAAAWQTRRSDKELISLLQKAGHDLRTEPIPYRMIYRQSAFLTQFSHLVRRDIHCPVAEARIRRWFCLSWCS